MEILFILVFVQVMTLLLVLGVAPVVLFILKRTMRDDDTVLVCDECLRASCWDGSYPCSAYRAAGVELKSIAELRALGKENESHWLRQFVPRSEKNED